MDDTDKAPSDYTAPQHSIEIHWYVCTMHDGNRSRIQSNSNPSYIFFESLTGLAPFRVKKLFVRWVIGRKGSFFFFFHDRYQVELTNPFSKSSVSARARVLGGRVMSPASPPEVSRIEREF
jgi:hypothetical protein